MSHREILPDTQKGKLPSDPVGCSSHATLSPQWGFLISRPFFGGFAAFGVIMNLLLGCGAVGKPIPPEEVGIEAKIKKQEQETKAEQEKPSVDEPVPITEQQEELPPFYPIGVR